MFCKYCGQPLNPGARFCENCGTPAPENAVYRGVVAEQHGSALTVREPRSRTLAGVLAIIVGALGIHNFYLGNTKRGLIQLLVSLFTCGTGAVGMWIWALVEGISLLSGSTTTDGYGRQLRD